MLASFLCKDPLYGDQILGVFFNIVVNIRLKRNDWRCNYFPAVWEIRCSSSWSNRDTTDRSISSWRFVCGSVVWKTSHL